MFFLFIFLTALFVCISALAFTSSMWSSKDPALVSKAMNMRDMIPMNGLYKYKGIRKRVLLYSALFILINICSLVLENYAVRQIIIFQMPLLSVYEWADYWRKKNIECAKIKRENNLSKEDMQVIFKMMKVRNITAWQCTIFAIVTIIYSVLFNWVKLVRGLV